MNLDAPSRQQQSSTSTMIPLSEKIFSLCSWWNYFFCCCAYCKLLSINRYNEHTSNNKQYFMRFRSFILYRIMYLCILQSKESDCVVRSTRYVFQPGMCFSYFFDRINIIIHDVTLTMHALCHMYWMYWTNTAYTNPQFSLQTNENK